MADSVASSRLPVRLCLLAHFATRGIARTALALTPMPSSHPTPRSHVQRVRKVLAQSDWLVAVDEHSGQTYYYNQGTGQTQWEPPYGASSQTLWRISGSCGVTGFNFWQDDQLVYFRMPYMLQNGQRVCIRIRTRVSWLNPSLRSCWMKGPTYLVGRMFEHRCSQIRS